MANALDQVLNFCEGETDVDFQKNKESLTWPLNIQYLFTTSIRCYQVITRRTTHYSLNGTILEQNAINLVELLRKKPKLQSASY